MKELPPKCDPKGVFCVKRVCLELGVSHKTLKNYREAGFIQPLNTSNINRPKYSGQSIIDCWHKIAKS